MRPGHLVADREVEGARALARRAAAGAVIGAAGGVELAVEAGRLPLLTVALGVHRVAQHVVDRYAVRTGVEAFAASRAAVVAGDGPVVFLEPAHVPRPPLPAP